MEDEKTLEETEETEKKSFWEEHPRAVFWVRFVLWVACGGVLPFLFVAMRFGIFRKASAISLSGWGIIAVLIAVVFVIALIRYIKKGFQFKNTFASQCINGVVKILIPLITMYVILKIAQDNLEVFLESLSLVIFFEAIAIPVNPMPKWVEECRKERIEEEGKDMFDYIGEKVFTRNKEKKDK